MAVQCYYIYSLQYVVVIKAYNVPVFLCLVPTTTNNQVFTRYDKLNIFMYIIWANNRLNTLLFWEYLYFYEVVDQFEVKTKENAIARAPF